jgi:putative Ca2+/H+ antiporter (TMEM165/GDT1 family)
LPPWVASFLIVFAAEWGDLTQLAATAGLLVHTGRPLEVGLRSLAVLWAVTLIAATTRGQLARLASPIALNRISAAPFTGIGVFMIVSAV